MSSEQWDDEMVEFATDAVTAGSDGSRHTVVAVARDADGRLHRAMNLFHFTGGPCAELAVIAGAAAVTRSPLASIVAVGDNGRGVLPPCGRCRQVMLDVFPNITVLLPNRTTSTPPDLLPLSYVWSIDG